MLLVWLAATLMPAPQPQTAEEAAARVSERFDEIERTLAPANIIDRSEEIGYVECPVEGRGDQAKVRRELVVDPDFDRVEWAAKLSESFPEKDGWQIRLKTLDTRDNLGIRIVGRDLIIVNLTASDESGQARVTLRSTSEYASTA